MSEYNEITCQLSIYADDRAVKAFAEASRESKGIGDKDSKKEPDFGKLMFELRSTVWPWTNVTQEDLKDILLEK